MVHDDLPYRAMRELAVVLTDGVNMALAQRDARLDRLEELVLTHRHFADDIDDDEICEVAAEVITSGDQGLFHQFCADHRLTEPEARHMVERWNRG